MFCTQCGNQLPDDSRFCSRCGAPVGAPTFASNQAVSATPQTPSAPAAPAAAPAASPTPAAAPAPT
ncbi:zinc-ribbon domain-containing protein, partial [Enorma massiliensis]